MVALECCARRVTTVYIRLRHSLLGNSWCNGICWLNTEHVNQLVAKDKRRLKEEHYVSLEKRKSNHAQQSGSLAGSTSINRFFDACQYKLWEKNFNGDIEMQKTNLDKANATRLINQHAPKLIECVCILKECRFFVCSFYSKKFQNKSFHLANPLNFQNDNIYNLCICQPKLWHV